MHRTVPAPTRMRRRLTIAFVAVPGVLTGALALGSFLLVREARLGDSLDRAEREAGVGLRTAANLSSEARNLEEFPVTYQRERGVRAVVVAGERRFPSDPSVDPELPGGLRQLVAAGTSRTNGSRSASAPTWWWAPGRRARGWSCTYSSRRTRFAPTFASSPRC